jgi:hypothetical protein
MGISMQFHAMPDELEVLTAGLLDDPDVFVVHAEGPGAVPTPWSSPRDVTARATSRRWIGFTVSPPDLPAPNRYEYLGLNPDALVWDIGQITNRGLEESWLASGAQCDSVMKRWRRAAATLRKHTTAGAIAVSSITGATAPVRNHRYTAAAHHAFKEGLAMLPGAGNAIIRFPLEV